MGTVGCREDGSGLKSKRVSLASLASGARSEQTVQIAQEAQRVAHEIIRMFPVEPAPQPDRIAIVDAPLLRIDLHGRMRRPGVPHAGEQLHRLFPVPAGQIGPGAPDPDPRFPGFAPRLPAAHPLPQDGGEGDRQGVEPTAARDEPRRFRLLEGETRAFTEGGQEFGTPPVR